MMRPAPAIGSKPTEPNVVFLDCAALGSAQEPPEMPSCETAIFRDPISRPEPFRIGARPLLIGLFAGAVLVALSGAFLIGLAVIGLLAAAIASFELAGRHLRRPAKPPVGALDHQVSF